MPRVVYGPPVGYGSSEGSTDVVSLGKGGEIVVSFAPNAIMDGPGVDFIVFENPFVEDGTTFLYAEPGEVSVSNDLETWSTFPCTQTTQDGLLESRQRHLAVRYRARRRRRLRSGEPRGHAGPLRSHPEHRHERDVPCWLRQVRVRPRRDRHREPSAAVNAASNATK
jgi:hypothetical protein